jgi:hypothetical protein
VVQAHGVADADGIGDGPVQLEGEVTDGQENRDGYDRQGHLPQTGALMRDAVRKDIGSDPHIHPATPHGSCRRSHVCLSLALYGNTI